MQRKKKTSRIGEYFFLAILLFMVILHHQGESEEPSGGKEEESPGKSSKGRKKSLNLNPRFSYLSYRSRLFQRNLAPIQNHVSVDMFGIFAARSCQVCLNSQHWLLQFCKNFSSCSPDCWKCSCWKCSFLTSWWWWSSRQEPEHCDVRQSVSSIRMGTY